MKNLSILSLIFSLILSSPLYANDFSVIPYQGTIANSSGTPYAGNYDFMFDIKNDSGATLWSSGIVNLTVHLGAYSVQLGESQLTAIPDTIWKTNDSLFLEISFNDGVNGLETLCPMIKFLPVPKAVYSKYTDEFCGDSLAADYLYSHWAHFDTITGKVFFSDTVQMKTHLEVCGDLVIKGGIIDSSETQVFKRQATGFRVDDISNPDTDFVELTKEAIKLLCPTGSMTATKSNDGGSIKTTDEASGKEVEILEDAANEIIKMITEGGIVVLPTPGSDEKANLEEDKLFFENATKDMEEALVALGGKIKATDKSSGDSVEIILDVVDEIIRMHTTGGIIVLPNPFSDEEAHLEEDKLIFENATTQMEQAIKALGGSVKATDISSSDDVEVFLDAVNDVIKDLAAETEHSNNGNMSSIEEINDVNNLIAQSFIDASSNTILEIHDPANQSQTTEGVLSKVQADPTTGLAMVQGLNPGAGVGELFAVSGANNVGFELNPSAQTTTHFGNLNILGNIAKLGGTFKIDHPLDPYNKYLIHSFVESPDMMNIYNGNVTTDALGFATVTLPEYFEALNMEFRYQLTVIGSFSYAIIFKEVSDNQFVIQTKDPNVKVSWQVTGVRKDDYANENRVIVEVDKEEVKKGTLLYPGKK